MTLDRRDWLRLTAVGAGGALAGWFAARRPPNTPVSAPGYGPAGLMPVRSGGGSANAHIMGPYGLGVEPPANLGPNALDAALHPPPFEPGRPRLRNLDLWASEQPIALTKEVTFQAWTYNGTVPGPIIRATEGDELRIHFRNLGSRPHNLHFHGSHDPAPDGWQPVPAGGEATYPISTESFGLYPYHCHTPPANEHISRGLYGAMIIDPAKGRPPAREVVLVLCGFDLDGDGKSEVYGWNGVGGFFDRYPIKVPVGDLVRVYLVNMAWGDPMASFHLHAHTFDVFRSGTTLTPQERTDVVTLAPTERAILEFRLPTRGRYMFHPHQTHMAERGAMGWFAAV